MISSLIPTSPFPSLVQGLVKTHAGLPACLGLRLANGQPGRYLLTQTGMPEI